MKKTLGIAIVLVLVVFAPVALAGIDSRTMEIHATVNGTCTLGFPINSLSLGTYDSTANSDGSGSIWVSCTTDTVANITINGGLHESLGIRRMTCTACAGGDVLAYSLFQDSSRTVTFKSSDQMPYTGKGGSEEVVIYGRIPSGQSDVAAGAYGDTVTVSINF